MEEKTLYASGEQYQPNAASPENSSAMHCSQNPVYDQNQTYNQNQVYGQNQTYNQNQAYGQNQTYNQNQAYGQNQTYNQNQVYGQNQTYGQNQAYQQVQPYQQQNYSQPVKAVVCDTMPMKNNNMAIAGLVIGIFAILGCWIPGADIVLAIIGIVCSGIGLSHKGQANGMAIGGLIISIIAFILSVFVLFLYFIAAVM